ncbi:MAG: DM13 domain-containing protein [Chloroflexi bacterium]|nr:DM13 domain-containing protein [Chloroflexota bacterium]
MAEFFGDLERFAADLYPYRWLISAGIVAAIAGVVAYAYSQAWHLVLWRHRRPVAIIGIPVLAMIGFVGYDLGSPLFTNKTVNEEFPFAFTATVPPDMSRQQVEDVMAGISMVDQTVQEMMPKSMAAAKVPDAPPAPELSSPQQPLTVPSPAATETSVATAIPFTTDSPPPPPIATSAPIPSPTTAPTLQPSVEQPESGPVKLKVGSFRDQDSFHKGSGQATIYRGPDGSHLLRIEDFKVTNGPDLHIFLSPHPNPTKLDELYTFGAVDLGKLKGNIGNQNYAIPEDVDVSIQMTVVIYCVPFHVFFSIASLDDVG